MNQNGKGDTPRPYSVPQEIYKSNYERIFGKKVGICEYSGLASTQSYDDTSDIPYEYTAVRNSGMFFEFYPGLTGNWKEDCIRWSALKR
jgi:hypothetical protein